MSEATYDIKTMQPYGNMVLLKLSKRKTESKGGIILPGNAKLSVWHSGKIIKTGPGKIASNGERVPMQAVVGKFAVFRAFDDKWEIIKGEDEQQYVMMPEESIEFLMNKEPD